MLRSRTVVSQGEVKNDRVKKRLRRKRKSEQQHKSLHLSSSILGFCMCFISLISVAYISYDHLYPKQLTSEDQIKQQGSSNVPNLRTKTTKRETTKKHDLPTDSLYNLQFPSIDGDMVQLSRFAGHSAVVINVASE